MKVLILAVCARDRHPLHLKQARRRNFQHCLTPQRHLLCCYPKGSFCTRIQSQEAFAHSLRESCTQYNHWPTLIFPLLLKSPPSDNWQQQSLESSKKRLKQTKPRSHTRTRRDEDYGEQGKLGELHVVNCRLSSFCNRLQQTFHFGQLKNCFTFTVHVHQFFLSVVSVPNSLHVTLFWHV